MTTTENASDAMTSTNKRVRFDNSTSAQLNDLPSSMKNTANLSSKGCALTSVRSFTVTLRQHLSPIIQKAGETHLDLLHKLMTKMRQLLKMENDDEFIPRSARLVNFDFRVSKKVEDHPEFLVVKADTDTLVHNFRLALKSKIVDTLKIECALLRTELYENLVTSVHLAVQAQLVSEQQDIDAHKIISIITHYYYDELFDYTDLNSEEFYNNYNKVHALAIFPLPLQTNKVVDVEGSQMEDAPQHSQNQPLEDQQEAIKQRDLAQTSKALLLGTFTRPGKAYFARAEEIEIDLSLKKLHATTSLEDATDATKNRLDTETSVDKELLDDLIRQEVALKTKKISAELGQLKRQLNQSTPSTTPKNSRRGQPKKTGASSKKKKSPSTKPKPSSKKTNAQPAAAPAKGTTRKPKGKKKQSERRKK